MSRAIERVRQARDELNLLEPATLSEGYLLARVTTVLDRLIREMEGGEDE